MKHCLKVPLLPKTPAADPGEELGGSWSPVFGDIFLTSYFSASTFPASRQSVSQTGFVHPQAASFCCCDARQTDWQAAEVMGIRLKICLAGNWYIAITYFGFDKFRLFFLFADVRRALCKTFHVYIASVVLAFRGHAWMGAGLIPSVFSYWTLLQY